MLDETVPLRGADGQLVRGVVVFFAATCALLLPSAAHPQVRKVGPEFQANYWIQYDQLEPRVDVLTADSFIAVWLGSDPEPGGGYGIRGRVFDRTLSHEGDEFLFSTSAQFNGRTEQKPSIAVSSPSGFVVVWESYDSGDLSDIGAQTFASDRSQISPGIHVNESPHAQQSPSVAANATDFVVVWRDKPTLDDYAPRTRARKFDWNGVPKTSEFGVTLNGGLSRDACVAFQPDGNFVVVWQEDGAGIVGQQFGTSGEPRAVPFVVSASGQRNPEIGVTGTGSFVVVWQTYGQDGSGYGIFGRRFAGDTKPVSEEFQINSYTADQQVLPSIATASSGEFVVLWESYKDGSILEGGQDGSGRGVFGQYFGSSGQPLGREFQANTFTFRNQGGSGYRGSDVAIWSDGGFVATWESHGQDGFDGGIFGQVFSVDDVGVLCGDANDDLRVTVRDALRVLRGSVGISDCTQCLCDVDSSGSLVPTDALLTLRVSTGLAEPLTCPMCEG